MPASARTRRISWVAYATDDSASLANTGSAMRLGSSVSPSRSGAHGPADEAAACRRLARRFGHGAAIGSALPVQRARRTPHVGG